MPAFDSTSYSTEDLLSLRDQIDRELFRRLQERFERKQEDGSRANGYRYNLRTIHQRIAESRRTHRRFTPAQLDLRFRELLDRKGLLTSHQLEEGEYVQALAEVHEIPFEDLVRHARWER